MKKKYLVVTLVTILILTIGVSFAYIRGEIVAKNKSNISLKVKELYILFTDVTEISEKNIDFGWEETKSFSIENQGDTTFYYNIIIEDLINTLESDGLQYKINSSNGYDMKEFKSVPKSSIEKDTILISNIPINGEETQEYTITLRYYEDPILDQSDDMGKGFSGKLGITEGEEAKTLAEKILEDNVLKGTRTSFGGAFPENADNDDYDESKDTESGLYVENNTKFTEDVNNDGKGEEVYYFAGNVKNNWVKFAELYFRIIRTNEDGSVRLLYAGDSADTQNAYINEEEIAYNEYGGSWDSSQIDTKHVGYKYGESGDLASNRLNTHNSTILGNDDGTDEGTLNWWYVNKILNVNDGTNSYDDYVSKTAIYCNDRAVAPGESYSMTDYFSYASGGRIINGNRYGKRPSFKCGVDKDGNVIEETQNVADKFSADKTSGGNGQLAYPVGLMTGDEVVYAGGYHDTYAFTKYVYYYLNSVGSPAVDRWCWLLISPSDSVSVMGVCKGDHFAPATLANEMWIRPVISLKSCATIKSGNGTSDTPYEVNIDSSCASSIN